MASRNTSNPGWLPNKPTRRLLDGLNLVFTIHGVYHYVVRNFGKYDQLDIVVWSFKVRRCDDSRFQAFINLPHPRRELL